MINTIPREVMDILLDKIPTLEQLDAFLSSCNDFTDLCVFPEVYAIFNKLEQEEKGMYENEWIRPVDPGEEAEWEEKVRQDYNASDLRIFSLYDATAEKIQILAADRDNPARAQEMRKAIAHELRSFRRDRGHSQKEAARLCHVSRSTITAWESGTFSEAGLISYGANL